jgi:hypothetical protein
MNRNTPGLIVVGSGILFVVDRYFLLSPVTRGEWMIRTAVEPIAIPIKNLRTAAKGMRRSAGKEGSKR